MDDKNDVIAVVTSDNPASVRMEMRKGPGSEPVVVTMGIGYARDLASRLHHAIAHLESIGKEAGK